MGYLKKAVAKETCIKKHHIDIKVAHEEPSPDSIKAVYWPFRDEEVVEEGFWDKWVMRWFK